MILQSQPDWTEQIFPSEFERSFALPFRGPGLYMTKRDTLLVIPVHPVEGTTRENIWTLIQPGGTLYEVHCYNVPFHETLLSVLAKVPTRIEEI